MGLGLEDMAVKLTIAIPTYNRNGSLYRCVERLLPLLTPQCSLLIYDNHSLVPAAEVLAGLLVGNLGERVRIVRHPANGGPALNFLSCYAYCKTEWFWMIGDDDLVAPDGLTRVLEHIEHADPDLLMLKFSGPLYSYPESKRVKGFSGLVNSTPVEGASNLIWISSWVYRTSAIQSNLGYMGHYFTSRLGQMALIAYTLGG